MGFALKFIPTTATQLKRIKKRAKELRPLQTSLGHALDAAAKELGYDNYHHSVWCSSRPQAPNASRQADCADSQDALVQFAIRELPGILRNEMAVDLDQPDLRAIARESAGLQLSQLWVLHWARESDASYFDVAAADFREQQGNWTAAAQFHSRMQHDLAAATWRALLEDVNQAAFAELHLFSFMTVFAGHLSALNLPLSREDAAVSQKLAGLCNALLEAKTLEDAIEITEGPLGGAFMPYEMNVLPNGMIDEEHSSTYWSRIGSQVAASVAGHVSRLPFKILQEHLPLAGKERLPHTWLTNHPDPETHVRMVEASRARWLTREG